MRLRNILETCLACLLLAASAAAQAQPGTDTLLFVDGEKLTGELVSANGAKVVFRSNMGFEASVEWSKIQELRSRGTFALVTKDTVLRKPADLAAAPRGTVEVKDQNVTIAAATGSPTVVPEAKVANLMDNKAFEHATRPGSFSEGWAGTASLGVSLLEGTTSVHTVTSSIDISRSSPGDAMFPVHNRTTLDFNSNYGSTKAGDGTSTEINLFNADLVQDHYLSPRWFVFAGASFSHNYSQGLDLLQAYGGGVGAVVYKSPRTEFDVRAGIGFMRQEYTDPTLNENLVGSRFNQNFMHVFPHGIVFFEQGGIRPAWNDTKNFFGGYVASLNIPVYHRIGFSISSFDNYVNNPPPYFKKNTFEMSIGASYTLK